MESALHGVNKSTVHILSYRLLSHFCCKNKLYMPCKFELYSGKIRKMCQIHLYNINIYRERLFNLLRVFRWVGDGRFGGLITYRLSVRLACFDTKDIFCASSRELFIDKHLKKLHLGCSNDYFTKWA